MTSTGNSDKIEKLATALTEAINSGNSLVASRIMSALKEAQADYFVSPMKNG
jgi:hypothetical protein